MTRWAGSVKRPNSLSPPDPAPSIRQLSSTASLGHARPQLRHQGRIQLIKVDPEWSQQRPGRAPIIHPQPNRGLELASPAVVHTSGPGGADIGDYPQQQQLRTDHPAAKCSGLLAGVDEYRTYDHWRVAQRCPGDPPNPPASLPIASRIARPTAMWPKVCSVVCRIAARS